MQMRHPVPKQLVVHLQWTIDDLHGPTDPQHVEPECHCFLLRQLGGLHHVPAPPDNRRIAALDTPQVEIPVRPLAGEEADPFAYPLWTAFRAIATCRAA